MTDRLSNIDHEAIAKLRRKVQAAKGIAARANTSAFLLQCKENEAYATIRRLQAEIEAMGGKVRR